MLEIAYADWLNLGFRWLHVIAGISWMERLSVYLSRFACVSRQLTQGVGGES